MEQHILNRLLRLAKKTGSPVILADKQGGEPMVLMPLDTYEAMIDGLMVDDDDFADGLDESGTYEEDLLPEVPLQEIDQDLPFEGEEDGPQEDFTIEDVPFDPPIADEPRRSTPVVSTDLSEERFYLEPIE